MDVGVLPQFLRLPLVVLRELVHFVDQPPQELEIAFEAVVFVPRVFQEHVLEAYIGRGVRAER